MECRRFSLVPGAKGSQPTLYVTLEEIASEACYRPISALPLLTTLLFTFLGRDGRAAGNPWNTGPAKPLRLKVRLVQLGTWESKMDMVGTNGTSPLAGCIKLKQTIL